MKIQLSAKRIIKDAVTVWHQHGPEVDIVMDLKNLTFAENSIESIYSFHVLDHLFPHEVDSAVLNWAKCLRLNGSIFLVVDDFEFIARSFVGGDVPIELINKEHNHPTQFTRDNMIVLLNHVGFIEDRIKMWFVDVPNLFSKQPFELIFEAQKV